MKKADQLARLCHADVALIIRRNMEGIIIIVGTAVPHIETTFITRRARDRAN